MGIAQLVECRTCGQKIASSDPGRSSRRMFFSRVNFLCWLLLVVLFSLMLLQWHVKDSRDFAKSAGGSSHLNVHTPVTQPSRSGMTILFRHGVRTCQGNEFTRNFSGNVRPQSSQLSHCGLILTYSMELLCMKWSSLKRKRKKRIQVGIWSQSSPKSLYVRNKLLHMKTSWTAGFAEEKILRVQLVKFIRKSGKYFLC